mgnify:CR=1 FL=1
MFVDLIQILPEEITCLFSFFRVFRCNYFFYQFERQFSEIGHKVEWVFDFVRNASGQMVPLGSLVMSTATMAPVIASKPVA